MGTKKVISVEQSTHKRLMDRGRKGETFDQVINGLFQAEEQHASTISELQDEIERLNGITED